MKKKVTIIVILLLMAVLIFWGAKYGIPAFREYQAQKAEEERRSQPAYYTEFHLTSYEFWAMVRYFGVRTTPQAFLFHSPDEEEWPDYSFYMMAPSEHTEKMVAVLSYNLFVNPQTEYDLAAAELATEYGFSTENPITVDWVLEHPVEAVAIHKETHSGEDYWEYDSMVEDAYNEIVGIEDTEETDTLESEKEE